MMNVPTRQIATVALVLGITCPLCLGGEATKKAGKYLKTAKRFEEKGLFEEAITQYGKYIKHAPEEVKGWLSRGALHLDTESFEEALADLTEAVDIEPKNVTALYLRGLNCRYLNDLELALSDLSKAADLDPTNPLVHLERGRVYALQGELSEAITDFDTAEKAVAQLATKWETTIKDAYYSLARRSYASPASSSNYPTRRRVDSGTREVVRFRYHIQASTVLTPIANQVGNHLDILREYLFSIYYSRGITKWNSNDPDGAMEDFGLLMGKDHWYLGSGIYHYLKGDFETARTDFREALSASRADSRDYVEIWLWFTLVNLGQLDAANDRIRSHFYAKSRKDKSGYTDRIAQFLLREIGTSKLLDYAKVDDPIETRERICEGAFYSAQVYLLMNGKEAMANILLDQCLDSGIGGFIEYRAAAIQNVILEERLANATDTSDTSKIE